MLQPVAAADPAMGSHFPQAPIPRLEPLPREGHGVGAAAEFHFIIVNDGIGALAIEHQPFFHFHGEFDRVPTPDISRAPNAVFHRFSPMETMTAPSLTTMDQEPHRIYSVTSGNHTNGLTRSLPSFVGPLPDAVEACIKMD
ncbi:MAG: hypothetical protein HY055_15810 [Magnetospirillum sp.]|nr:hypothetical protein [Magnetospirillum sp.]